MSHLTLQSCKDTIVAYLKKQNIADVTKFEISIHHDKLRYLRWDYSISKPKDVVLNVKPLITFPQSFHHVVDIGSSREPFKYTTHEFTYPFDIVGRSIHIQISPYQSTYSFHVGHDDIFSNVRSIGSIDKTRLRVEIDTFRVKQEPWMIEHKAFLLIIFT
jgi:hypothetical protein